MKQVRFRLLQLVLSTVGGDKVTVGLFHWDEDGCVRVGLRMTGRIPGLRGLPIGRVRAMMKSYARRAAASKSPEDLAVTEDPGSAFPHWQAVATAQAADPAAHFRELAGHFGLRRYEPGRRQPSSQDRGNRRSKSSL